MSAAILQAQTARHDCQPAFVLCLRKKAISKTTTGKTAAQGAVGCLGIQNRYEPDYEVVLATNEPTVYNPGVSRRTNEPP